MEGQIMETQKKPPTYNIGLLYTNKRFSKLLKQYCKQHDIKWENVFTIKLFIANRFIPKIDIIGWDLGAIKTALLEDILSVEIPSLWSRIFKR